MKFTKIIPLLFLTSTLTQASFLDFEIYEEEKNLKSQEDVPVIYQNIVEEFKILFEPVVIANGGNLEVVFEMDNPQINATASRDNGMWYISFKGGLVRHRKLTPEVFTAILCHELGHHLGGHPFKFPGAPTNHWISVEGQSDYYATNICMKKLNEFKDNRGYLAKNPANRIIKEACINKDEKISELCQRNAIAADKTGAFMSVLSNTRRGRRQAIPNLSKPDQNIVRTTFSSHPKAQCRLDTYFQGAVCQQLFIGDPELMNCPDEWTEKYSGARPRCWYAP